jgi:hypothetical protein
VVRKREWNMEEWSMSTQLQNVFHEINYHENNIYK